MTETKHTPEEWKEARQKARATVKARLDLFKVCEAYGVTLRLAKSSRDPRAGDRVFSPLRDDGKSPGLLLVGDDSNGRAGRVVGAKDMSTRETFDLFSFAEALTGKEFKEAAEWLYQLSGVKVEDYLPDPDGTKKPSKPVEKKPETDYARRKRLRALSASAHAKFAEPMLRKAELPPTRMAPAIVAAAWKDGQDVAGGRVKILAAARGWPVEWVQWLFDAGEISWPELPWGKNRCIAFRVRHPNVLSASWKTLGYHQRVVTDRDRFWIYAPYVPAEEKCRTDFQRELLRLGCRIPALPFVIGDPFTAKRWIIAEGQWDALTAWGILGGFDGQAEGVCALGLRGAGSVEPLQAVYEPFWLAHPPEGVVVFCDNDKAGGVLQAWQPKPGDEHPRATFDDRLRKICGAGKVTLKHPQEDGWDLNDLYKKRPELSTAIKREIEGAWT